MKTLTGTDPKSSPLTIQEFYEAFGINEYACIDADGANDALVYDLNCDISKSHEAHRTYDIVTNFGTTEHVFNQYNCFKQYSRFACSWGIIHTYRSVWRVFKSWLL